MGPVNNTALVFYTPDLPPKKTFVKQSGRLFICVALWLVVHSVGCCHAVASSDDTLAFEDAQIIPPFSREETAFTDETDYTDETDDTIDTDDTDDTDDNDNIDDIDDTKLAGNG